MKTKLSIFSRIIRLILRNIIHKIVDKHDSDYNCKGSNAWTHLVSGRVFITDVTNKSTTRRIPVIGLILQGVLKMFISDFRFILTIE